MAEDFRMYRLTGTKPKSRTIGQFFADLFNFIYTFFTGRTKLHSYEIDKLYDSINRGQFRYSKITTENAKLLEKVETPMAIDLRKTTIPVFNNYRELDKTVMFLLSTLIHTNQLDDLNNIENIKMSKMWTELENIRARVEGQINATQKKLDDNLYPKEEVESRVTKLQTMTNFVNILKTVDDVAFKPLFVEKLTDYLNMLNVKVTMDEDFSLDNLNATNYKTLYDMASYEVSSKDNMLASVKFLIATLPKTNELDPHIGIPDIVNFNEMWNSLMHNLYGVDSVEEMMDRLKEYDYIYSYKVLIDKLEKDTTGLKKEQLRTAIQKHRHSFVNFLLKLGRDGKETVVNEIQISKC